MKLTSILVEADSPAGGVFLNDIPSVENHLNGAISRDRNIATVSRSVMMLTKETVNRTQNIPCSYLVFPFQKRVVRAGLNEMCNSFPFLSILHAVAFNEHKHRERRWALLCAR